MRATILAFSFLLSGAVAAGAQVRPDPGGTPLGVALAEPSDAGEGPTDGRFADQCLEPRDVEAAVSAIGFEGHSFRASGDPEPISSANLELVGEDRGVPLFAGKLATQPLADLWVPICAPAGHYQLYTRLAGTVRPGGS